MEIRKIVNEHGHWFETEEVIHNYNELLFNKEGLVYNDQLIVNWEDMRILEGILNREDPK